MDCIDIHIDIPAVAFSELHGTRSSQASAKLKETVQQARDIQSQRFDPAKAISNAAMTHHEVEARCQLDNSSRHILKQAMSEFGLSARARDKICKIARTIADLDGAQQIGAGHVAEAISYRKLDRKL